jgi:metal-responsive CopG/Arc/MetJ family transcriptional regulator
MERELHNKRVQIVAPKSWVQMVDEWRKKQPENINRSEAIRIMTERLVSMETAA